MQQKLIQNFFTTFGNNIGKESQKPRTKLKNIYITYLLRIFALPTI